MITPCPAPPGGGCPLSAGRHRPLPLRVLPPRLRLSLWARYYRARGWHSSNLYASAPLEFAPGVHLRLVPGDVISDSIAFTGVYELALTRRVRSAARRGGLMVEVGANLGYFALLWASASPLSRAIAVEASPRNIEILTDNVVGNGMADRVRILAVAAGAAPGRMAFDPGPESQTGWGGLDPSKASGSIDVDVARLDDLVGTGDIALLKIDAEGADTWVLEGCRQLLRSRAIREIWFEQNKPRMQALGIPLDRARMLLRESGYHATAEGDTAADVVEWRAVPL